MAPQSSVAASAGPCQKFAPAGLWPLLLQAGPCWHQWKLPSWLQLAASWQPQMTCAWWLQLELALGQHLLTVAWWLQLGLRPLQHQQAAACELALTPWQLLLQVLPCRQQLGLAPWQPQLGAAWRLQQGQTGGQTGGALWQDVWQQRRPCVWELQLWEGGLCHGTGPLGAPLADLKVLQPAAMSSLMVQLAMMMPLVCRVGSSCLL